MTEERKRNEKLKYLGLGLAAAVGLGFILYKSQSAKTDQSGRGTDGKNDSNKEEQITFYDEQSSAPSAAAAAAEAVSTVIAKDDTLKAANAYNHDDQKDLDPDTLLPNESLNAVASDDVLLADEDVENKQSSTDAAAATAAASANTNEPKEESPVIVDKHAAAAETAPDLQTATPQKKKTAQELEAEEQAKRDAQRLTAMTAKYATIADRVQTLKRFRYKNGKLRVKLLRATNVDDKDFGKKDLSDVFVKFEITNEKHKEQSTIQKDKVNPVWNETFVLNVKNALREVLTLQILDYDAMSNDKIGEVKVNVADVVGAADSLVRNKAFDVSGSKSGCKVFLDLEYFEVDENNSGMKKKK